MNKNFCLLKPKWPTPGFAIKHAFFGFIEKFFASTQRLSQLSFEAYVQIFWLQQLRCIAEFK